MIVNNQNQKWESHEVALCHVWNCDRLIRLDQCHTYVKPEWFGSPWADGLDVVAICSHHIVGKGERIEVLNDKPLSSAVRVQEPEQLKDFVFKHEVIDGNDFLYQEWLMDINEGSPHRHIGGAL